MKFTKSQQTLQRALKTTPFGSQTFSKSYYQFPEGCSPLYLSEGNGATVKDVDGNTFVDLISGLMAITLGYNDATVNAAIINQLKKGISFSLSTELEYELSERLVDCIPCAEKCHFVKNGSDATSAAIRIARAHTGRDHIAVCGYHGWHDWYIGNTSRNKGVPAEFQKLVTAFPYNNIDALAQILEQNKIAAVIMEPVNAIKPHEGYLQSIKELAHQHGALLIFDEMVTGFHFSLGGAQQYFNVIPDLACFGKGMGNGMPISAVVGKSECMNQLKEVFVSGTFGGETLSLAAAIAVIDKMKTEPVIEHFWRVGQELSEFILQLIQQFELQEIISLQGYHPWTILGFKPYNSTSIDCIKSFFIKEMIASGVLIICSNNINFSHKEKELAIIKKAYYETFSKLEHYVKTDKMESIMSGKIIKSIFKIR